MSRTAEQVSAVLRPGGNPGLSDSRNTVICFVCRSFATRLSTLCDVFFLFYITKKPDHFWPGSVSPWIRPQLHPVVVPQSSQTMQWPDTFIRIELQLLH